MLHSMTGYGEAAYEDQQIRIGFRIRSVNNKSQDISIKLPFDFMYLEAELRKLLAKTCFRGRFDVFSEVELRDPDLKPPTPLNRMRMTQLMELCREIKNDYEVGGELDINQLIGMQDLTLTQRVGFRLPEHLESHIKTAFTQAIERLEQSRRKEGGKLGVDMIKRLKKQQQLMVELQEVVVNRRDELKEQIMTRVQALMDDTQLDPMRLSQEVVYYADRLDISEEITRLEAHQGTMLNLLESDRRPLGKELDFLVQEQMREVTTIGNKARHQAIADMVVRLKTGYEAIREQVQNLE